MIGPRWLSEHDRRSCIPSIVRAFGHPRFHQVAWIRAPPLITFLYTGTRLAPQPVIMPKDSTRPTRTRGPRRSWPVAPTWAPTKPNSDSVWCDCERCKGGSWTAYRTRQRHLPPPASEERTPTAGSSGRETRHSSPENDLSDDGADLAEVRLLRTTRHQANCSKYRGKCSVKLCH